MVGEPEYASNSTAAVDIVVNVAVAFKRTERKHFRNFQARVKSHTKYYIECDIENENERRFYGLDSQHCGCNGYTWTVFMLY